MVSLLDESELSIISGKALQLSHIPAASPALQRIALEANYYLIHHTVALEGNTMSLQQVRALLETGNVVPGGGMSFFFGWKNLQK